MNSQQQTGGMAPAPMGGGGMPQSKEQAEQQMKQKQEAEEQRDIMLSAVLTQGARDRLHRVSLVKPEKAKQVEDSILQRAKRGIVREKVSEDTVIQMLQAGAQSGQSKASSVTFKRRDLDDDDEW